MLPVRTEELPARLLRRLLLTAPRTVLFVCVENACRSLMAEAMFNADPPPGWTALSAGTRPARAAHQRTAAMLKEIGLAPPSHPPRPLTYEMVSGARECVTMGCLDDASCPAHLKGVATRDWALPDPAPLDDEGFRRVRDNLLDRVRDLKGELVHVDPDRAVGPNAGGAR